MMPSSLNRAFHRTAMGNRAAQDGGNVVDGTEQVDALDLEVQNVSDEQSKNQLEGNGDEGITEGDDERGQRFLVGENVDVVHQAVLGNAVKEVHIRKAVEQGSGKRIQLEHHKTNDPGDQEQKANVFITPFFERSAGHCLAAGALIKEHLVT